MVFNRLFKKTWSDLNELWKICYMAMKSGSLYLPGFLSEMCWFRGAVIENILEHIFAAGSTLIVIKCHLINLEIWWEKQQIQFLDIWYLRKNVNKVKSNIWRVTLTYEFVFTNVFEDIVMQIKDGWLFW